MDNSVDNPGNLCAKKKIKKNKGRFGHPKGSERKKRLSTKRDKIRADGQKAIASEGTDEHISFF